MPTSVTINGTAQNVREGRALVTIDATVAGVHHQVTFLKEDLLKYTSAAALKSYIAQQFKQVDTNSAGFTGLSDALPDVRGTVSV